MPNTGNGHEIGRPVGRTIKRILLDSWAQTVAMHWEGYTVHHSPHEREPWTAPCWLSLSTQRMTMIQRCLSLCQFLIGWSFADYKVCT
mmetsp:Transcript_11087/g.19288  ORF Transcript_11087/g.19288 Transcript_11087/m.19288 type:complete len:88 (-) Transcript_11087:114-377(-)